MGYVVEILLEIRFPSLGNLKKKLARQDKYNNVNQRSSFLVKIQSKLQPIILMKYPQQSFTVFDNHVYER